MILSPYRNPPYRTPTPKRSVSPPPGTPKRKRADSEPSSTALHVDTTQSHDSAPETGADSPRTNVAKRLEHLDIQQSKHSPGNATPEFTGAPRKRLKRSKPLMNGAPGYELDADMFATPESSSEPAVYSRSASPPEIGETPDCRSRVLSSPPLSPGRLQSLMSSFGLPPPHDAVESKELPPPPPPTPLTSPQPIKDSPMDQAMSLSPSVEDHSINQIALTWQDNEITGHDIDTTSPDDDGLGINGIGFKPTPAMAHARSQKRKQQVSEWRAREAREARQRRFDRRRGTGGGEGRGGAQSRRAVRFEEVG